MFLQNCPISTFCFANPGVSFETQHSLISKLQQQSRKEFFKVGTQTNIFKGTIHPKIKNTYYLHVVLFISLDSFGVSCLVWEISAIEISAFSLMTLNGAHIATKVHLEKLTSNLFPEIMTLLLKIIHRPCCEQFHVGTTFLLTGTTFLPTENCSQQGLRIILSNRVMIYGKRHYW